MEVLEQDFIILVLEDFKVAAESESTFHSESVKIVLQKLLHSSIHEIKQAYDESISLMQTVKFILALMIVKLSQSAPLESNFGVNYFLVVDYFINTYPELKSKVIDIYLTGLEIEILNSDEETVLKWAKVLEKYSKMNDFSECFKLLSSKLLECLYSKITKLSEVFSVEVIENIAELMKFLYLFDEEQSLYISQELVSLILLVIDEYDLRDIKKKFNLNFNKKTLEVVRIAKSLKGLSLDLYGENKKCVNLLISKAKEIKRDLKKPFKPIPIIELDLNKLSYSSNNRFYIKEFERGAKVEAFRGFYDGEKAIIKYYSNCFEELIKNIKKEIDILGFLSKKVHEKKLLLNFFGAQLHENNCILVIEDGGDQNLMEYITSVRNSQMIIPQITLETWTDQLITTFAWFLTQGIAHRDIKPHNILVQKHESGLQLKIIDFSVSDKAEGPEDSFNYTQNNLIQGSKGYLAPEIFSVVDAGEKKAKYNIGKADVFSLGLTILQLYTLNDYVGWNNPKLNANFAAEISNINASSRIKTLLSGMLQMNPKSRLSFNGCLCYLEDCSTLFNN